MRAAATVGAPWRASRGGPVRPSNAASAVMAGMRVVVVACDDEGNVDVDDLRAKMAPYVAAHA